MLNSEDIDLATQYFLGNTEPLLKESERFSRLFLTYITDNNSSTLRELVTLNLLGYKSYDEKHGADGIDINTNRIKEVKPKFLRLGQKLGSSGNFNDMTLSLLEKKKDFDIICSLFSYDRLIYLIEFPLSVIYDKLRKPIDNAVKGKRVVCHFTFKDYDNDLLKVYYFDKELAEERKCLSKTHISMLESRVI